MTSETETLSAAALALTADHRESETRTERAFLTATISLLFDHLGTRSVARFSPADIAGGVGKQAKYQSTDDRSYDPTTTDKLRIHIHYSPLRAVRYEGRECKTFTRTASINSGSWAALAATRLRPAKSIASVMSMSTDFIAPIYLSSFILTLIQINPFW